MRIPWANGVFIAILPLHVFADVFSLSNLNWSLKNANGSIVIPARVPSQAHLDLLDAGVITEPLLGINDFTQRWIVNDNWTYTADLGPFTQNLTSDTTTLLVFYGIDTIANISVSGHPVAWVNDQFQHYVYDITDLLSSPINGDTNVTVALESAWYYGLNITSLPGSEPVATLDFEYPGVRQWIRKTQSDFGWDFGPAFVPSGVFRPAYLVTLVANASSNTDNSEPAAHPLLASTGSVFVEETSLEISKVDQTQATLANQSEDWLVNVTLAVRSVVASDSPTLTISIPELNIVSSALPLPQIPASTNASTFVTAAFTIPDGVPERWSPHNLGTPRLYNFTVTLSLDDVHTGASFNVRSGFRTIELAQGPYTQEEIDERGITPGDQWHFIVNGEAFYALGSNIAPFGPFYARVTSAQVRWVLESAVQSGQNLVRAWGGGIYHPSDELTGGYDFYGACDELGILAWSELIFSDSGYPSDGVFLDSVQAEVRQNIRRINHHPSNTQWAGSNEIEVLVLLVNETYNNATGLQLVGSFQSMWGAFLHDVVTEETSSVAYTDCSTTNGVLSLDPYEIRYNNLTAGYIYGNTERYNYDASVAFDYSTYPVARFVNEFGFLSMPSFYSWEEVLLAPEDFSFNSTVVASRDHHPPAGGFEFPNPNAAQGQGQMTVAVELWLPTPSTTDTNQTFAQWCWSTQVFQSLNMVSEIAWYRRGAGLGENNLGAVVWQQNDIWQGAAWSAMEYSGRWKVLQYGLASIYSPVIIYPFWYSNNETLQVLVTSDRWETVEGTAQLTWYDWTGSQLNTSMVSFEVPTLNNSLIFEATGLEQFLPAETNATDVFLLLNVTAQVNNRTVTQEQVFTPATLADVDLVDPKISVTSASDFTFTLSAKGGVAAFAWMDHPKGTVGYFQDTSTGLPSNGFYLIPGIDRTLKFIQNVELSEISSPNPADFVVRSLWNNTHL